MFIVSKSSFVNFNAISEGGEGFPHDSVGKESTCNAGDTGDSGLVPGLEDPLEEDTATHSILAWGVPWIEKPGGLHTVHGVPKSWIRLSD